MPLTRTKPMNRGTGFKPKAPAKAAKPKRDPGEFKSFKLKPAAKAVMVTGLAERPPAVAVLKDGRHESEAWRRAVAALPCVLCGAVSQTQCAHRNEGKGMSLKTDDALTAALCVPCHSAIDQGKDFTREERRQRLDLAILLTIRALARAGKLKVTA